MIFITGNEERLGIRHISKSNTVHIHLLYPFLFMVHFVFFSSSNPKRFHDVWHSPYKVGPTGWKLVLNRELHSKDARKYNCQKPKCKWSYVHQLSCLKKKQLSMIQSPPPNPSSQPASIATDKGSPNAVKRTRLSVKMWTQNIRVVFWIIWGCRSNYCYYPFRSFYVN